MFCTKCGKQNANDTKFCVDCGNPLKQMPGAATAPPVKKQDADKPAEINAPVKPVAEKREIRVEPSEPVPVTKPAPPGMPADTSQEKPKIKATQPETVRVENNTITPLRKKKTGIVITIILLIAIAGGAAGYWYYNEQQALKYFGREYSGYINNARVNVNIIRQGYTVSGSMSFTKPNLPSVSLNGTVDGKGNFSIYTSDMTVSLKGKFIGKTAMTGIAGSNKDSKTSEFNLLSNSK